MTLPSIAAAALLACALPAQALLLGAADQLNSPTSVIDFEAYDGFMTTGPEIVAPGVTFTGDNGSELGAFERDLGDNGAWGAGAHFAASGFVGELRFTFAALSTGAGAFVNSYALDELPLAIVVSAYGDNNQIIETYTVAVDTAFDSYNDGLFVGIARSNADIRSISFKGAGVVVDDLTYGVAAAVPELESYALMLGGLALLGAYKYRSRRAAT